ncbi:MAG TPA: hypothetical protein VNM90_03490 [Haliangium sp.]|nr:hypothetical protein [Haliangium sp.]
MKQAIQHLDRLAHQLAEHPLCEWMTSAPLEDARRHYDPFLVMMGWIINFRYYNEMYLAYDLTAAPEDDELTMLKQVINEHVQEDRTHVRMFLQDIRQLELAELWRLQEPSSLLWTMWVSPMLDDMRAGVSERVAAVVAEEDAWPVYRYLHIEQVERDGNLMFSAAHRSTDRVVAQRHPNPIYFGEHHLDRETGRLGGEAFFEQVTLSPEQTARARGLLDYKHSLSLRLYDAMHRFVVAAEKHPFSGDLLRNEQEQSLSHVRRRIEDHQAGRIETPRWTIRPDACSEQSELIGAWHRHHADFVDHPFARRCREAGPGEVGFVLRCAALLLANRITALHTFYLHDCRVEEGSGAGAREVDFIRRMFATEAETFFHDWDVLEMDRRIPWPAADMLEWWFLDRTYGRPEIQTLHEWRRQVLRVNDPIGKYWAIMSVHIMSRAFFGCVAPLAERFSAMHPDKPRLVYFENLHHLLYNREDENFANPGHPTSLAHLPISEQQRERLLQMMDTFARLGMRQFDNMARALTEDREQFAFLRD